MLAYLLFCLVCYGITVNLVYSITLENVTKHHSLLLLTELLSCMKCTGFWVGVLFSLFLASINSLELNTLQGLSVLGPWRFEDIIWTGFLSSGACWLLDGLRPGEND